MVMRTCCLYRGAVWGCLVGLAIGWMNGGVLGLAQDGQAAFTVVHAPNATKAEAYAARELAEYLGKISGAAVPVVAEKDVVAAPCRIFVGWTAFAAEHQIDAAQLGHEEWVIRSVSSDLVIAGGRPRGTLYGVYAFLERELGCHWLDHNTEVVPKTNALRLENLDRRGKPAFWFRSIYTTFVADASRQVAFAARNMANNPSPGGLTAQHGFEERYGSPGGCHTFAAYAQNFPADRPEYLSMNSQGKRIGAKDGSGPGGICLMHPEVRKLVLANLRAYIAKDRENAAKSHRPPPRVYDISQNDNHWMCQCPDCKAMSQREGSESGPVVDFINAIADGIRAEYHDVYVMTFAYSITEKPPQTLKTRDNVMIRIAELNAEWGRDSDLFHPLTHPVNKSQFERLQGWSKVAQHIAEWDYWIQYSPNDSFPTPYAPVSCLQPDLETFHRHGVSNVFVECESPHTTSFFALKCWLGYQLMQDPCRPAEPLIQTFMQGYYGAAGAKMREYLKFLEDSIAAVDENLSGMKCYARPYLTLPFYLGCQRRLDEAEALCATEPQALLHVRRERVPVDAGMCHMWDDLTRNLPADQRPPLDRKFLIDRYERYRLEQLAACPAPTAAPRLKEQLGEEMARLQAVELPLPESFGDLPPGSYCDFTWPAFRASGSRTRVTADPDAAGGKALQYTGSGPEDHARPLGFGVYDGPRRVFGPAVTLKGADVPQDENYHWYKVGRFAVTDGTRLWAHWTWLLSIPLDRVYKPDEQNHERDIWVSLKVTGPAYVKDSKQPNAVSIDRVLVVAPRKAQGGS